MCVEAQGAVYEKPFQKRLANDGHLKAQLFAATATCNASSPQRLVGALRLMWRCNIISLAHFPLPCIAWRVQVYNLHLSEIALLRNGALHPERSVSPCCSTALLTSDLVITIKRSTNTNYLLLFNCFLLICSNEIILLPCLGKVSCSS